MNRRLKASLIAASIAALPFGADAAGLGRLNVMSALGQPLRAEVELSASAQELQSLIARVPSPEAFKQANVAYSPAVGELRLAVEPRGGRSVLKISSDKPLNSPFVDMLIELNWAGGHVQREYTFLLDPVDMAQPRPAMEGAAPVARPVAPPPSRPAVEAAPSRALGESGTYEVQRGDTLRRIAADTRPEGVSLDQMMVALFQGNRSAFEGENINRLKAGKILKVPDAVAAKAISPAEARKEIFAQSTDFEGYRRSLAAAAPAQSPASAGQESGGKITPKVADAPAPAVKDQVKVSSVGAAKPGEGGAAARLQALEEDVVARDKALQEANARLAELEKNIQELQKLVEMKSQGMAQAQQAAQGGAAAPAGSPAPAPAVGAAPAPESAPPPPPKARPAPPPPPPREEPGFLPSLLSDPLALAGGGGVLALLLGYAGFKMRSGRKAEGNRDAPASNLSNFPESTQSLFGAKGGQRVDTGNSSLLHTDFSQSGMSSIDADEGVDPVAEADVYMAYGRDAQAEEILIDALKVDPSRGAVYVKLLEIYAHRKSLKQFDSLAGDFYAMTGGKGLDWEKAAAVGRRLDPGNPMFNAGGPELGTVTPPVAAAPVISAAEATTVAPEMMVHASSTLPKAPAAPVQAAVVNPTPVLADVNGATVSMKDTWALPGDLSQLSDSLNDDGANLDLSSARAAAGGRDLRREEPALDFNLDLDEPAKPRSGSAGAAAASAGDLAFDLDLGPATDSARAGTKPVEVDHVLLATTFDNDLFRAEAPDLTATTALEFNIDDDSPVSQADLPASLLKPAAARGRDVAVDLTSTHLTLAGASARDAGEVDLEQTNLNSNLIDFDFDLDDSVQPPPAVPVVDLSSIDLNLDGGDQTQPASSEAGWGGEEGDTKLELAWAYEEMGDRDGAKELLEEVLRDGSAAQQKAARALLARLT